jgi:adenylate cyclase
MTSTITWPRGLAALALAVFVAVLGFALRAPEGLLGGGWVRASYDSLHIVSGADREALRDCPIVIVYLDLNSFHAEEQNPTLPWPRALHARLLRQLAADGVRCVVFDIVFSEPGPEAAADIELAKAIRENGRVILAGEANEDASHATSPDQAWARLLKVGPPAESFATHAAGWGVASHIIDKDFVVRRYLAGFTAQVQPSLTWATAEWLLAPVTRRSDAVRQANRHWIRYYGPALTLPHVSYTQALDPAGVPPGYFRDKIVLIGARPMVDVFEGRQDEFRNPFHSWGH